jgi:hypothetical protein
MPLADHLETLSSHIDFAKRYQIPDHNARNRLKGILDTEVAALRGTLEAELTTGTGMLADVIERFISMIGETRSMLDEPKVHDRGARILAEDKLTEVKEQVQIAVAAAEKAEQLRLEREEAEKRKKKSA